MAAELSDAEMLLYLGNNADVQEFLKTRNNASAASVPSGEASAESFVSDTGVIVNSSTTGSKNPFTGGGK